MVVEIRCKQCTHRLGTFNNCGDTRHGSFEMVCPVCGYWTEIWLPTIDSPEEYSVNGEYDIKVAEDIWPYADSDIQVTPRALKMRAKKHLQEIQRLFSAWWEV